MEVAIVIFLGLFIMLVGTVSYIRISKDFNEMEQEMGHGNGQKSDEDSSD